MNNLLQFKLSRAGRDVGRVVINSTVGLLGVIDVVVTEDRLPSSTCQLRLARARAPPRHIVS